MAKVEAGLAFCSDPLNFAIQRPPTVEVASMHDLRCEEERTDMSGRNPPTASLKGMLPEIMGAGLQDAIVRALAAFLVQRAKAEALASLTLRVKDKVCGDPQGKALLPYTCTLIGVADPYVVPLSWGAVKAAAEKDLHDLPLQVLALQVPRQTHTSLKDSPELIYVSVDFAEQVLIDKVNGIDLLVGLRKRYRDAGQDCATRPAACALLVTGLATEVIAPDLDQNVALQLFGPIAARLIVERAEMFNLVSKDDAKGVADWTVVARDLVSRTVAAIRAATDAADAEKKETKGSDAGPLASFRIRTHAAAVSGLLLPIFRVTSRRFGLDAAALERLARAISVAGEFVASARQREYLAAAGAAVQILDLLETDGAPAWAVRYLPMFGELAQAQDAEQVEEIMQAVAAPVGSWRAKRGRGKQTLSVNGYVGLSGGSEWLHAAGVPSSSSLRGGLFGPVGLEWSWGICTGSSLGVLVSVLDLGAFVDVRAGSETDVKGSGAGSVTVQQDARVGFSQVLSPGIAALWGIPDLPVVLGFGAWMTPKLRRVTFIGTETTEEVTAIRAGVFAAIDVTLFPF
jgi:hypothetical protein